MWLISTNGSGKELFRIFRYLTVMFWIVSQNQRRLCHVLDFPRHYSNKTCLNRLMTTWRYDVVWSTDADKSNAPQYIAAYSDFLHFFFFNHVFANDKFLRVYGFSETLIMSRCGCISPLPTDIIILL